MIPLPRAGRTWWPAVTLLAIAAGAFALRVWLAVDGVFGPEGTVFLDTDAWYHMRLVDSLIVNYPHRLWFDPYLLPGGQVTQVAPLFDWLIAGVALVIGAGRPSADLVDAVGAYVPAVIGALTTVPVYFLGRELFSRRAGLFAAAVIAVLPGEVLMRSLVGFTDHHCLEAFLSASTILFLVVALKPAQRLRHTILFTVLTGLSLGAYLLTWSGGAFLIAVLGAWGAASLAIERLRNTGATRLLGVLIGSCATAAVLILPWVQTTRSAQEQAMGLTAALLAFPLIWGWGRIVRGRVAYLAGLLLVAAGGVALLLWSPFIVDLVERLREVSPTRRGTVAEATPLLRSGPHPLWSQFTTSLYLAVPALGVLLRDVFREGLPRRSVFLVWTAAAVIATIGQVRFSYYLAISVAVLAGAACDVVVAWVSRQRRGFAGRTAMTAAALTAVVVLPNVPSFVRIHGERPIPPESWAYDWLRDNTPNPFPDADTYYQLFPTPPPDQPSTRTASYGVLASWWRGYTMIRMARRVPNANGSQAGARDVAAFLLAEDEDRANQTLDRINTRYVMTDWAMVEHSAKDALPGTQFYSLAVTTGRSPSEYRDLFYRRTASGTLEPVVRYYPSYYRTMAVRLHVFGGAAAVPLDSTWVISFSDRLEGGRSIKQIESERLFDRYEDAAAFVDAAKSDHVRLVGQSPSVTPVPLTALADYTPVYHFPPDALVGDPGEPLRVRIFEYRRWKPRQ